MIYLDYNATTPIHDEVVEAMLTFLRDDFGNPSSRTHEFGRRAERAVSESRKKIASMLGIEPKYLVFTSGATEANNIVILGLRKYLESINKKKIITTAFEHKAVLEPILHLRDEYGFEVVLITPDTNGHIALESIEKAIDESTGLVSVMHVNNEVGTVQQIEEIGKLSKRYGALFHSDGAQGFAKLPLKMAESIDFYTASAHKIGGPKGIGGLFINGRKSRKALKPIFFGGGQEDRLRPGTLAPAQIVGFKIAAEKTQKIFNQGYLSEINDCLHSFYNKISKSSKVKLNAPVDPKLPTTLNFRIDGVRSEALFIKLKEFALSNGSACTSDSYEPSHVLTSLGMSKEESLCSIRLSVHSPVELQSLGEFLSTI